MPNPPVQTGNIYESRDRRELGRKVKTVCPCVGKAGKWACVDAVTGHNVVLSEKNLRTRWKLVSTSASDTLQELLCRMESVHPSDLAPSLRDLRSAWLEAGCPGLRKVGE